MLDGLMRLDFNVFREVPFERVQLRFTNNLSLVVKFTTRTRGKKLEYLDVGFHNLKVQLHPSRPGAMREQDIPKVEEFRKVFFEATKEIQIEFIDTERLTQLKYADLPPDEQLEIRKDRSVRTRVAINPKAKRGLSLDGGLAKRVARFIGEAQLNYRQFFSTTEPDLFPKIIEKLTTTKDVLYTSQDLTNRLKGIYKQDQETNRLGLEPDRWNYEQLIRLLKTLKKEHTATHQALTVIGTYVEHLESRAKERELVADRLRTFEKVMDEFFTEKSVRIDPSEGFKITTAKGDLLKERQLSSGEFHLLYLMVAALVTRRRGTVLAIDEPEMSMHIAWQRKLIPALVRCASGAEPIFIFATHSPDLAGSFKESMVQLG